MNTSAEATPRWQRSGSEPILGVVMIVRDEAENLPHLFRTLRDVADEVVVVDTGSTDGTQDVCREWGVKLVQEQWRDDFAWARNRSIEEATARYLLWLDGDDRLPAETQAELRKVRDDMLPRIQEYAFILNVLNTNLAGAEIDVFRQVRLFPRRPGARFRNAIHERITDSLNELGVELVTTEWVIEHTGYADPEVVRGKNARNERLLRQAADQEPASMHLHLHLAQNAMGAGRVGDAERSITEAIVHSRAESSPAMQAELHMLRSAYRAAVGQDLGAVYDLEKAMELWPEWGVPYASLAQIRAQQGDWAAVHGLTAEARTRSFEPGIVGFRLKRLRSNVEVLAAEAARHAGEPAAVPALLRAALEIDPGNFQARLDLGQALLDREAFEEAREVLEPLGEDEAALERFVEVAAAIGLARAMTGDEGGAGACLAPLLDLLSDELGGADDVSPMDLARAMLQAGHGGAARNMLTLYRYTVLAA